MRKWIFAKGHGTMNDFVVVLDRNNMVNPSADDVRNLCHRRKGVGGDGVLRAVKARHIPEWDGDPELWFMDYRNADGSTAEMCGNGLRVFVRYLLEEGFIGWGPVDIATRAGLRRAWPLRDGRIRTWMGQATVGADLQVCAGDFSGRARQVDVGNPHAVALVDAATLEQLHLELSPTAEPASLFPNGANFEFVHAVTQSHLRMRVYERGVGETASCGTGVVAAAVGYAKEQGIEYGTFRVDVPGGTLEVELAQDGAYLTGPAVIVGTGEAFTDH